jgi:hypothetical protein
MRLSLLAALSVSPLILSTLAFAAPKAKAMPDVPKDTRVSGPIVHGNLAVYFIHGASAPGKVPLTLEEALIKRVVQVHETGNVNQLEIENLGNDEVFIQSGDIVKGGRQDRTLMVSLVLPPKSGRVAIDSFCVEQGRWSARGREDVKQFSTASAAVPSREMKLAMKAPKVASAEPAPTAEPAGARPLRIEPARGASARRDPPRSPRTMNYARSETSERQGAVWDGVRKMQGLLAGSVGGSVASPVSSSSLQLAMENEKLIDAQKDYVNALKPAGEADDDIVGYVFAVNGKLNSADVYPSNALFRKMWTKLLNASAIEAISHKDDPQEAAVPATDAVTAFLGDAERGNASEKQLTAGVTLDTREGDGAYFFETTRTAGWVHRNYLAK